MDVRDKRRILTVLFLVGFILVAMVVMTAYAAEIRCENNALIAKNEALEGEVDTLHIQINTSNNIEHIEKAAREQGMIYPTQDNCVYLTDRDAPGHNFAAVMKSQAYN